MTVLTYAEIEGYWINAGGNKAMAPLMAAIAMAESRGNPDATNPTDNNGTQTSWGLWQISDGTHNQVSPTWNDPATNAKLALQKYDSEGLGAWGTYTSGKYKDFLQGSVPPNLNSPVNGSQKQGGVTQASLPGDVGSAISKGILDGISGAMGPVLKWGLWFAEMGLGIAVMIGGVILLMQQSGTVRSLESAAGKSAIPELKLITRGQAKTLSKPPKPVPAAKPKPETNPYSGRTVRNPEREKAAILARRNAAAEKRVTRARVAAAEKSSRDPRREYSK